MNWGLWGVLWFTLWVAVMGSGVFLLLFGGSWVAWLVAGWQRRKGRSVLGTSGQSLEVLLPTFCDVALAWRTLESLDPFLCYWVERGWKVSVHVGMDGSPADQLALFSASLKSRPARPWILTQTVFSENRGKWDCLRDLIGMSRADWCVLVDSGALWAGLHENGRPLGVASSVEWLMARMSQAQVEILAPRYAVKEATLVERLLWSFEAFAKNIENGAGGPISVHGVTAFYRRDILWKAVEGLDRLFKQAASEFVKTGARGWLNDDLVLPLMARHLGARTQYLSHWLVSDAGLDSVYKDPQKEQRRRLRIHLGNTQWMRWIWPDLKSSHSWTDPFRWLVVRRLMRVHGARWLLGWAGFGTVAFGLMALHSSGISMPWTRREGVGLGFLGISFFLMVSLLLKHPVLRSALRVSWSGQGEAKWS